MTKNTLGKTNWGLLDFFKPVGNVELVEIKWEN